MAKIIIGEADWSDYGSMTNVGSEEADNPATNLRKMQPSEPWVAPNLANVFLEIDRSSVQPFNVVSLLHTNATSDATWRIRAADDQVSLTDGTEDFDSGSITFRVAGEDDTWDVHHSLHFLASAISNRWVRIDVSDSGNPDNEFTAGRLIIGDFWQPARNLQYPIGFGHRDPSEQQRTHGSALYADDRPPFQVLEVSLDFLTEADMLDNAFDFRRRLGRQKDMLIVVDPDEATRLRHKMVHGLITNDDLITNRSFNRFTHKLVIEEMK